MHDLRIGLVGASRGLRLVESCRDFGLDGFSVTGVYDPDHARSKQAGATLDATVFSVFEELLASNIDAVVIASPIPAHTAQLEAASAAGKAVLCEVTPCSTIDDARRLVRAVRASGTVFMLAENYCYFSEVELVRRLHGDGRFGEIYYAECDHLIDIKELWRNETETLTWRGRGEVGVYSTHGLGPLLTILNDRVATVSALTVPGGQYDSEVTFPTMHLMHLLTEQGRTMRLRIDLASSRPPLGAYYAVQGTRGAYESWRGLGDVSKIWLEDEHGPSTISKWGEWQALDGLRGRYLDDSYEPIPQIDGADARMMRDFLSAVRGEIASPFDVDRALDFTLPGILAETSAAAGGASISVPDTRSWG